ncbi:MAG TPA: BON domain-containing protein [Candidatus Dormibacteraeota bacterium]|jgi:hypothetical protein|nr:BON domain-containing protein [Candidatus Dormibacteraeota bacterium]
MSLLAIKERGQAARDELGKTYDALRELVAERVNEVDGKALRNRGTDLAGSVRKAANKRIGKLPVNRKQRRSFPVVPVVIIGAAALGAAAVTAYFLYDRNRRDMVRDRVNQVGTAARERYVQLGGVSGAVQTVTSRVRGNGSQNGADLRVRVEAAIAAGEELPGGLQIDVEGRTVYLKGEVADAKAADAAAERAHSVDGVVAVVNRTTTPSPNHSR